MSRVSDWFKLSSPIRWSSGQNLSPLLCIRWCGFLKTKHFIVFNTYIFTSLGIRCTRHVTRRGEFLVKSLFTLTVAFLQDSFIFLIWKETSGYLKNTLTFYFAWNNKYITWCHKSKIYFILHKVYNCKLYLLLRSVWSVCAHVTQEDQTHWLSHNSNLINATYSYSACYYVNLLFSVQWSGISKCSLWLVEALTVHNVIGQSLQGKKQVVCIRSVIYTIVTFTSGLYLHSS